MQKTLSILCILSVLCILFTACAVETKVDNSQQEQGENNAQIANPASVNCEDKGGKLEIRTMADGGQQGFCKFDNGKECEEWALYRGECNSS